jgi:hypothetical protein
MIELEVVPVAVAQPRPRSRVQAPRPSRPRGWWIFLAPLAVLVIVIAFVVIAGGSNDDRVAEPAPSTTAAVSETTVAPSSSPAPSTSVAPLITVNSMPPVSGVSFPPGDVWGTARRWTLVSFTPMRLTLLDLGTGMTESFDFSPPRFSATQSMIAFSDHFVFTTGEGGRPSVRSQRYRDEPSTLVLDNASILTASTSPGLLWVALENENENDRADGKQRVAEIDRGGRLLTTLEVPPGLRVLGAGPTGLWLSGSGRIYSLDRDGRLIAKEIGSVVDVSPLGVLVDDCAIAGPCTLRLAGETSRRIGPSAEMRVATGTNSRDPALSPNGRWLLLADGLLDRQTGGQVAHSFEFRTWRWSPDSEWLFLVTTGSAVLAWNPADGRQITFARLGDLSGVVAR